MSNVIFWSTQYKRVSTQGMLEMEMELTRVPEQASERLTCGWGGIGQGCIT